MSDDGRVYFIGAGASKQDRFPLTSELKHGLAWSIRQQPKRFAPLAKHLAYLYHVSTKTVALSTQRSQRYGERRREKRIRLDFLCKAIHNSR